MVAALSANEGKPVIVIDGKEFNVTGAGHRFFIKMNIAMPLQKETEALSLQNDTFGVLRAVSVKYAVAQITKGVIGHDTSLSLDNVFNHEEKHFLLRV